MRAEQINPFLTATVDAFRTMLDCSLQREQPCLRTGELPMHEFSGVIGLSGSSVGMVVLSLSRSMAERATATMLMTEPGELTDAEIVDAVGELANVVAGAAKAKLGETGLSISLPTVVTGTGHEVRFPSEVRPICVPFSSAWGSLTLDVGMAPARQPVGV